MIRGLKIHQVLPSGWRGMFAPIGRVGIGVDLGTTTKKKSNPTAIAIIQQVALTYYARLVIRFKTKNPDVTRGMIEILLDLPHGLRVGRICVDATNERFFATDLKRDLLGKAIVELVINSESLEYRGQSMNYKSYLGNLFVNTIDDGYLALPPEPWLERDVRLVVSEKGSFDADVDEEGNHADTFDAIKLAIHALNLRGGPAQAREAAVGSFATSLPRSGIKSPFARLFDRKPSLIT